MLLKTIHASSHPLSHQKVSLDLVNYLGTWFMGFSQLQKERGSHFVCRYKYILLHIDSFSFHAK